MKFSFFRRPKVETQDISVETRVLYHLKLRNKYFERHAGEQPLFLPEYEISKEILEVIAARDKTHEDKLVDIVNIYNRITQVDHYDGTGWFDFQIVLEGYFRHYGYSVDFEKDTGIMRFDRL